MGHIEFEKRAGGMRDTAPFVAGLACFWPGAFGPIISSKCAFQTALVPAAQSAIEALSCLLAVVIVAAFVLRRGEGRASRTACGALAVVGCTGQLLFGYAPTAISFYIGLAMCALYCVAAGLFWGAAMATRVPSTMLPTVLSSAVLGYAVQAVISALGVEGGAADAIYVAVSCICLAVVGMPSLCRPDIGGARMNAIPWALVVGCLTVVIFEKVLSWNMVELGTLLDMGSVAANVFDAVICAALVLYAARSEVAPERQVLVVFIALLMLFLAGLAVVSIVGVAGGMAAALARLLMACGAILRILLWAMLGVAVSDRVRLAQMAFVAYPLVVVCLPRLLVALLDLLLSVAPVGEGLSGLGVDGAAAASSMAMFAAAFALAVAMLHGSSYGSVRTPYEKQRPIERLAVAGGLTEREIAVLGLICRGYSAKAIAEVLAVSTSTVNYHTDHIYKKLQIHSRQELIELAESYGG